MSIMRFADWNLSTDGEAGSLAHETRCAECEETSGPRDEWQEAQDWALTHAGRTWHTWFRATVTGYLVAAPAPSGNPPSPAQG